MTDIKDTIGKKINFSKWGLYFKITFIFILMLLMMIPSAFIKDLIHERSSLLYNTQQEIASTWGGEQVISGPLLSIPFKTSYKNKEDGKITVFDHVLYVSPEQVHNDVGVTTEERKKGIYSTTLYTSTNNIKATFVIPDEATFGANVSSILYNEATIWQPVNGPSAINKAVYLNVADDKYKMRAYQDKVMESGLKANIDITDKKKIDLSLSVDIRGSKKQSYIASGADHRITIVADWPSPGFEGSMLPSTRDISESGFTATWSANEYSRPMPEFWMDNEFQLNLRSNSFGVRLVQTVDHYQKNFRSIKYSLLIISLSFLVFFFFEMLSGRKIHSMQYILIGLALSLFYLLLLSFSEHTGFNVAYIIASLGTVSLVTWYSSTMLAAGKSVTILASTLVGLYAYIYVLLQMEDYALLVGSVGLFVILAAVMGLSRKLDWSRI